MTTKTNATGIIVSTGLTAGSDYYCPQWRCGFNHVEGIVVSTDLMAGPSGLGGMSGGSSMENHAEGIVVSTAALTEPIGHAACM